jgi:hypothetical protein
VSGLDDKRRAVVEIREDLHQALRKTAILNELKLYVLVNGIVEDALRDQERLKILIRSLKL